MKTVYESSDTPGLFKRKGILPKSLKGNYEKPARHDHGCDRFLWMPSEDTFTGCKNVRWKNRNRCWHSNRDYARRNLDFLILWFSPST